jgi:hypothetical protein
MGRNNSKQKTANPRRMSRALPQEHLASGAFLLQFTQPREPENMFRRAVLPTLQPPALLSGADYQSVVDKYRTMERKGFCVTKDTGCLIPHPQYCTTQQGATLKGHQRSFALFARWLPGVEPGSLRNEYGWPASPQISHLCHRRSCCRPDHLVAEEQWRNLKRHFCGLSGQCDCGNDIKCLKRYTMEDHEDQPPLCTTREEVLQALQGAPEFTLHAVGVYQDRDTKALQRKDSRVKRKRKQALHAHETRRKQARLSQQTHNNTDSQEDSGGGGAVLPGDPDNTQETQQTDDDK